MKNEKLNKCRGSLMSEYLNMHIFEVDEENRNVIVSKQTSV